MGAGLMCVAFGNVLDQPTNQPLFFLFLFSLDYVRLVLNLAAFYFILSKPFLAVALHFTGGIVLDVLDGIFARYLNQCK